MRLIINFFIFAFVHSFTAGLTFKEFAKRVMKSKFRYYRTLYVAISLVSWVLLMYVLAPTINGTVYRISEFPYYFLRAVQALGVLMLLISLNAFDVLNFFGIAAFFDRQSISSETPEPLNTKGLYGLVRHPIYLFSLVIVWANPIMTNNWLLLCVLLTAYCYIGSIFEERKLVLVYGERYLDYQRNVPRLIPYLHFL